MTQKGSGIFGKYFNPLPSHEGRRNPYKLIMVFGKFQSTPLSRGETVTSLNRSKSEIFQSTPLSRGETRGLTPMTLRSWNFNPLPSHEGRPDPRPSRTYHQKFQSTPLSRGETAKTANFPSLHLKSIMQSSQSHSLPI